jgi:tRNA 2-selenouridine synthase
VVVGGLAGAGKTDLLHALERTGEQVLDLEALACHRGSAFGSIGLGLQPSHSEFARLVEERLAAADPAQPLWVEDEGAFIGSVGVPERLQRAMGAAPVVELRRPFAQRVERFAAIYGRAEPAELLAALGRMRRRLGGETADRATALVRSGDVQDAIALVLPYFDATYAHRMRAAGRTTIAVVSALS